MFRKRNGDGRADEVLRASRPVAPEALVEDLSARVGVLARRPRRRSRATLASAVMVLTFGVFASFGGFGYAASGAQSTATAVKQAVAPSKASVTASAKTSADDQYGEQSVPVTNPPVAKPPVASTGSASASGTSPQKGGTLPFTGLGLATTALVGGGLLAFGIFLRRRESRE